MHPGFLLPRGPQRKGRVLRIAPLSVSQNRSARLKHRLFVSVGRHEALRHQASALPRRNLSLESSAPAAPGKKKYWLRAKWSSSNGHGIWRRDSLGVARGHKKRGSGAGHAVTHANRRNAWRGQTAIQRSETEQKTQCLTLAQTT